MILRPCIDSYVCGSEIQQELRAFFRILAAAIMSINHKYTLVTAICLLWAVTGGFFRCRKYTALKAIDFHMHTCRWGADACVDWRMRIGRKKHGLIVNHLKHPDG